MTKCFSVVIADTVTQMDWVPDYEAAVSSIVDRYGGRYLARAAGDSSQIFEGDREPPVGIVLVEWPSKEAAEAFYADPDYRPHRAARLAGTTGVSYLVEGLDDA